MKRKLIIAKWLALLLFLFILFSSFDSGKFRISIMNKEFLLLNSVDNEELNPYLQNVYRLPNYFRKKAMRLGLSKCLL
jgi:hypothetical protein